MKKIKVYEYPKCSTCQNALKFLDKHKINYEKHSITETPPQKAELREMLDHLKGDLKKLFNTSGIQYREMGLSQKMKDLSEDEAIQMLSKNGKLIRRPFLLAGAKGAVGFKEAEWKALLKL